MRAVPVEKGMVVRLYEEDDWFWQGKIVAVNADDLDSIDVDYGDWIQRYPRQTIRLGWTAEGFYEEFLAPFHRGVKIQDFNDPDFSPPPLADRSVAWMGGSLRRTAQPSL